jgi:glycerol-3-phosphate acyltransferase PlsY
MNTVIIGVLAAVIGYLLGSLSFARIVTALVEPGRRVEKLQVSVPDSDVEFESDVVSATTVRLQLGAKYGCLTSLLDMLKAALPTLAFRFGYPDEPYYLIAAGMVTVGHIWPLYYRFKGGRGMSPILGGMLAIDPLGVVISHAIASLIGIPLKNTLISIGGGIALMAPWLWFRTGEALPVIYTVAMNGLFWYAMRPEVRTYSRLKREGKMDAFSEAESIRVAHRRGSEHTSPTISQTFARIRRRLGLEKEAAPAENPHRSDGDSATYRQ